jgi:hypothetical protein
MRPLILIAGALALAACGNNDQSDNTPNVDENLSAENIVSNDVTAIDAVTGDAANMAAESDINDIGAANASNADMPSPSQGTGGPTTKRPAAAKPAHSSTTSGSSTGNSVSSAASNTAD